MRTRPVHLYMIILYSLLPVYTCTLYIKISQEERDEIQGTQQTRPRIGHRSNKTRKEEMTRVIQPLTENELYMR